MFQIAAVAYMRLDQIDDGRQAAIKAAQYANGEAQADVARRLRASIDDYAERRAALEARRSAIASAGTGAGVAAPGSEAGAQPAFTPAADAPRLRLSTPTTGITAGLPTQMMAGRIVEIVCLPNDPRLVLHVVNGENVIVRMLIDDPARVLVSGPASGVVEMTCGKQDQRVSIGFAALVNPRYGTEGYVRTLDYGK